MVDGQMAKHRRDPKPNIPRDVACLGCQHCKRIRNIKAHTALRCADSAPPHRSRFRGAGRKSVMPNGQHDGWWLDSKTRPGPKTKYTTRCGMSWVSTPQKDSKHKDAHGSTMRRKCTPTLQPFSRGWPEVSHAKWSTWWLMARWQDTVGTQNQIYHAMSHVLGVNTVKGFKT